MQYSERYLAFMGMAPKRIPHFEYLGCPDAETFITGIDHYEHPRACRQKLAEMYPMLNAYIPETDDPKPRPNLQNELTGTNEFACGAQGVLHEPYTNARAIALKHENCFLAGEGDTRILSRNNPDEIRAMVGRMIETARITGGYFMRIGNEFTWNTPPEAVKLYLDTCRDLARR